MTIVVFAIMLTERLVGESIRQTSRYLINGAMRQRRGVRRRGRASWSRRCRPADRARRGRATPPSRWAARWSAPSPMPFELLGVLLVVALLGALYFARSED